MVGINVTGAHLNNRLGQITQDLRRNYEDVLQINAWLLSHPITDAGGRPVGAEVYTPPQGGVEPLVTLLGIPLADCAVIRQAAADLAYQKAAAFDSSTAVRQMWGIGS